MSYAVGFDLGGTNIKAVAVTEDGELLEHTTCPTEDDESGTWAEKVRSQLQILEERRGEVAKWVGMAAPGVVAPNGRSIAHVSGRLRGLQGFDWTDYLKSDREIPVINDAQAALLGEAWRGAALGCRHAILITLGTGVGGAILSEGKLMKGLTGRAGDFGHVTLDVDGQPDHAGIPGSLEDAIGDSTLAARSKGRFTSTLQLVEAHLAGDVSATEIWIRSVYQLSCAIASLINIFDPEVIIIGGGIARAGRALFEPMERFRERLEWRPDNLCIPVIPAALGDLAGALGAAYNAMQKDAGASR
ncbi:MAG TPA: ROK family protein [Pyrinomonadaceae bacterium]|nr:ROK family protein [Pyrinomonadaceae bacterium]